MAWEQLKALETPSARDIIIATPHVGDVSYNWAVAFKMLEIPPYFSYGTIGQMGAPIDDARNILVTDAFRHHAKYIFFLDSDVIPKHDTLIKLVKHNLPIVSGVYFSRAETRLIVGHKNYQPLTWNQLIQSGIPLIELDEVGTGCLLVDMRVFDRMMTMRKMRFECCVNHAPVGQPKKKEFFDHKVARENEFLCPVCKSRGATNILVSKFFKYDLVGSDRAESEDYYFCRIARELGFKIYIDLNSTVTHESAKMHISESGIMNPITSIGGKV